MKTFERFHDRKMKEMDKFPRDYHEAIKHFRRNGDVKLAAQVCCVDRKKLCELLEISPKKTNRGAKKIITEPRKRQFVKGKFSKWAEKFGANSLKELAAMTGIPVLALYTANRSCGISDNIMAKLLAHEEKMTD